MAQLSEVIHQSTIDATDELFSSYDVPVRFTETTKSKQENINGFLGMIGFSGVQIRGNLSIWAAVEVIEKSGNSDFDKTDWIAEIANQLLGRIKNKILKYDVEIMLGTPTSIETGNLILNFIQRDVRKYRFEHSEKEEVVVFLDAVFDDVEVVESADSAKDAAEEGDLLLF